MRFRITFTSDWGVGTGAGVAGGADRVVARDDDGLPYVPASTVRQVLRDASEIVAGAIDGERGGGDWGSAVASLFGDRAGGPAGYGVLTATPATIVPAVRAALVGPSPLARARRDALVAVVPSVRIDDETGTAMDRHLRFVERSANGLTLEGELGLVAGVEVDDEARLAGLLQAAAGTVRGLGAQRRRGAGRCTLSIVGAPGGAALRAVLDGPPPLVGPAAVERSEPAVGVEPGAGGERRVAVAVDVQLLSPVVARSAVRGNVTLSHDHVPGHVLLPLVARSLAADGVDVRSLLATDQLTVTPATPVAAEGRPLVPIPLSWAWPKGAGAEDQFEVIDTTVSEPDARVVNARPGRWVAPDGSAVARVRMTARTRNRVDVGQQRVGEAGVYTRQAIAGGQRLRAHVLLPGHLAAGSWRTRLTGDHRIGTARRTDDGRVRIVVGEGGAATDPAVGWSGDAADGGDELSVLCTTACAAPTPTAAGVAVGVQRALAEEGIDSTVVAAPGGHAIRVVRYDTWHGRWNLPRPTIVALAPGSVVSLQVSPPLTAEARAALHDRGIGARRGEGFGRIALASALVGRSGSRPVTAVEVATGGPAEPPEQAELNATDRSFVELLDGVAVDRALAAVTRVVTRDPTWRSDTFAWSATSPRNTQLGQLRAAASGYDPLRSVEDLLARIEQLGLAAGDAAAGGWSTDQVAAVRALANTPRTALGGALPPWLDDAMAALDVRADLARRLIVGAVQAELRQRANAGRAAA